MAYELEFLGTCLFLPCHIVSRYIRPQYLLRCVVSVSKEDVLELRTILRHKRLLAVQERHWAWHLFPTNNIQVYQNSLWNTDCSVTWI